MSCVLDTIEEENHGDVLYAPEKEDWRERVDVYILCVQGMMLLIACVCEVFCVPTVETNTGNIVETIKSAETMKPLLAIL